MKDIKKDFKSFVVENSRPANSTILENIHQEIAKTTPSNKTVACKIGGIHLVSSFFTLMACPQFGTRLFFHGDGLMEYFMKVSSLFCQTFCGAFYIAVTILLARVLLNYDEWLILIRSRVLTIATLALGSLGVFAMLSRGISFEAGVFWFFGAAVAGEAASLSKHSIKHFFSRA